jgi:hypothetical protein
MRSNGRIFPELTVFFGGIALVCFVAFLIRYFYVRQRFSLGELMFLLLSINVPLYCIFVQAHAAGRLNSAKDVIVHGLLSVMAMMPMFCGAWWGARAAERLDITNGLRRIGLMLLGFGFVMGVIAILTTIGSLILAVSVPAAPIGGLPWFWPVSFLVIPGAIVERRCNAVRTQAILNRRKATPRNAA